MGSAENLGKKLKLNAKTTDALALFDSVLGAVSAFSSATATATSVLQMMGFLSPASDPFQTLLDAIQQDLKEIYDAVFEASTLEGKRSLADIAAWSKTTAIQATKYIKSGRQPANPAFIYASDLDNNSLHTTILLGDDFSYWHRLFNINVDDPWLKEPNTNYIWDYRLTLPYYLQAIASRLIVIEAIEPDYRTTHSYSDEINGYASTLGKVRNKIKDGIIKYGWGRHEPPIPSSPKKLHEGGIVWFWTVESLHTGLSYNNEPLLIFSKGDSWELFVNQIEEKVEAAYVKLCRDVGLFKLEGIIKQLNHLANSPPLNSLNDLVQEIGTVKLMFAVQGKSDMIPFPRLDNQISMRHLASIVGVPSPISLRKMIRQQVSPHLL